VQSHEINAPGEVRRISVSVIVDGVSDPAQMEIIKSAVQVAAGINAERGDQLAVETFTFDRTAMDALTADLEKQQQQELYVRIGMGVASALVVLALLFFILRLINNTRNASKESWRAVLRPVSEVASLTDAQYKDAAMRLQDDLSTTLGRPADKERPGSSKSDNEDVVVQLRSKGSTARVTEDEQNSRIISRLTEENPATVAEIIQIWLNEGQKS
jgi:flagellar M-ring protein FliF